MSPSDCLRPVPGGSHRIRCWCFRLGALLVAGMLGWLAGCSRPPAPDPDLVARVGTHDIRVAEFQDWMRRRGIGANSEAKAALLQEMLDHYAAVQRAEDLGLAHDPALRRTWENLLVERLRTVQLESQFTNDPATPAQIQAWYTNHLDSFGQPALRRGAMIFAAYPDRATAEQMQAVHQRLSDVRSLALQQDRTAPGVRGFGSLAVQYSEDQITRYRGGDLGWLVPGKGDNRYDPAVNATLFALSQTNEISEVLDTLRGCYLVKLLDTRAAQVKPLASVLAIVQQKLRMENRQQLQTQWQNQLRAAYPAQTFEQVLSGILPPTGQTPPPPDQPAAIN